MPSPPPWSRAALAGFACSMRTFAGPALLAARGRFSARPRDAVLLAAAGELAFDKSRIAKPRIDPPSVAGRLSTGAYTGHTIGGWGGAAVAAAGAAMGTYATYHARKAIVAKSGLPDWAVAVGEDLLAIGSAALATQA